MSVGEALSTVSGRVDTQNFVKELQMHCKWPNLHLALNRKLFISVASTVVDPQ